MFLPFLRFIWCLCSVINDRTYDKLCWDRHWTESNPRPKQQIYWVTLQNYNGEKKNMNILYGYPEKKRGLKVNTEKSRADSLMKLGLPERRACEVAYSESLLWKCKTRRRTIRPIKRKTCTRRIFWYIPEVQVSAYLRLNRSVQNGTHGDVRGRLLNNR